MGWGLQAEEKAEDWPTWAESEPDTMHSSQMVQKNQHTERDGAVKILRG